MKAAEIVQARLFPKLRRAGDKRKTSCRNADRVAGRTLINSIDPGTRLRVSFRLSGAQQERRDPFRSPSLQA